MQQTMKLALAAAIACGGIGLTTQSAFAADNNQNTHQRADSNQDRMDAQMAPTLPMGVKVVQNTKTEDMTETLESVVENAVEPGEFDDVVGNFVDQDRNRIGNFKNKTFNDLDTQAKAFQKAWKEKYGDEFEIDRAKVFSNVKAAEGEIQDPQQVLKAWPVDAKTGRAKAQSGQNQTLNDDARTQGNIDKGTEIGVVHLPKAGDMDGLYVSMLDEAGGWKVDLPNDRTGQQIHDDLLQQLKHLNQNKDSWPSNKTDATRMVSNCVLSGIYGVGK